MKCPGQDSRYWDGEAVFDAPCPYCGVEIEFFKDDATRKCPGCGKKVLNPRTDFGCASYCPYAEQCLGELPPGLIAGRQELLVDRVAVAMKKYFRDDFRRIGHATKVARYVGEIGRLLAETGEEEGYNPAVASICGYLHDIGIKEAERKFNSSAPKYQHQEGPPVARAILEELGANPGLVDEVCDIISHHHTPRGGDSINFRVLYDADLIVNVDEERGDGRFPPEKLASMLEKSFLTKAGPRVAEKVWLAGDKQ